MMDFNPVAANDICERIAHGESLRKICGEGRDESLPGQTTVYQWLATNEEFAKQYAHARECQAETYADEVVEIADEATDASLGRLQMDARKWAASKLAPKKYGDKLDLNHAGTLQIGRIERTIVGKNAPDPNG